ncbi:hypothetical protein [Streptomyces clavuligerus]|uniref:Uncharacterized protein n=1 Tax=Streptomyces clavuligerus TaxID=1901 RepID=B5GZ71_STRCL|nr:hypothetical protein [Streptomyces clavuligerus]EDY51617.1 hypothetical protein SSCG_04595 [Streptomyces clavuligerus]EFG06587.1 Hypothetical protein SCLAV_1512 [Streptomyces clavuligerus]
MDQHSTLDPIWDAVPRLRTRPDDHSSRLREDRAEVVAAPAAAA